MPSTEGVSLCEFLSVSFLLFSIDFCSSSSSSSSSPYYAKMKNANMQSRYKTHFTVLSNFQVILGGWVVCVPQGSSSQCGSKSVSVVYVCVHTAPIVQHHGCLASRCFPAWLKAPQVRAGKMRFLNAKTSKKNRENAHCEVN